MKRWFSLVLLMGALLGLIGQEAAFARVLPAAQTAQTIAAAQTDSHQMNADCAEMMTFAQQPQPGAPCQGMTPDCIAKMGCAVPVALIPPHLGAAQTQFHLLAPRQMPVAQLIGREISPEPHPPSSLG